MLPREGEAPKGTMVSLTLGHRMEFRKDEAAGLCRTEDWERGKIKSKGSRRLPRSPLKSLAGHQAAQLGGQTRAPGHSQGHLVRMCKLNSHQSSHNTENICLSASQGEKTLVNGGDWGFRGVWGEFSRDCIKSNPQVQA